MQSAEERLERLRGLLPGIAHRADALEGGGTSIAANEIRHLHRLLEKILNGEPDT